MISIRKLFEKTTEEQCACCDKKLFEETECPNFSGCCFCRNDDLSRATKKRMQEEFCLGDFKRCARYKMSQTGKSVPLNLSPYGEEY